MRQGNPKCATPKPRSPEARLRRFCILRARERGHDVAWVRALASELFGLPPEEGFCLTALSKVQLIQLADRVVRMTGGVPGRHRPGPGPTGPTRQTGPTGRTSASDRSDTLIVLASREEIDLATALAWEVFGDAATRGRGDREPTPFGAFLWRMTRRRELRLLTRGRIGKVIEALKQMSARGWRPTSDRSDIRSRTGQTGPTGRTSEPDGA